MTHSSIVLRRAAALREMASLGITHTEATHLLDLENGSVSYLKAKFGIVMRQGRRGKQDWLQQRLLRDYGRGLTTAVLAERYQTSANSVKVTVHRMRKAGVLPGKNAIGRF